MRSRARPGQPDAAAAPGTASPAAGRPPGLRLIAAMLIAAAALDLTRCSLVLITFRHLAPAVGLIAAGIGAAVVSGTAARGYQARQRWAVWAALLIYGFATLYWIYLLQQVSLTRAYPFAALSFVLVPLFAWLIFGDAVTLRYAGGVALIVVGVYLSGFAES